MARIAASTLTRSSGASIVPGSAQRSRATATGPRAIVDAYGESEQIGAFYTAIDEHLAVPLETTVLGMAVAVRGVDLTDRGEIVAVCSRGRHRQAIPILDLPP